MNGQSFHGHVISFDSSRPHTAATPDPTNDEHLSAVSPQKLLTQTPVQVKSSIWHAKQQLGGSTEQSEISQLVYHTSDFTVSSIVDNPKVFTLFVLRVLKFKKCKIFICILSPVRYGNPITQQTSCLKLHKFLYVCADNVYDWLTQLIFKNKS